MAERIRVLFVCLGNICRSPLAEGVFLQLVEEQGLAERFEVDSAGTSAYHLGEGPDARTVAVAARRGVRLEHAARQVVPADLERFDFILTMDTDNLEKVERLAARNGGRAEVQPLRAFDPSSSGDLDVPDPYFGGESGFEHVHDIVERASRGLLEHIRRERGV